MSCTNRWLLSTAMCLHMVTAAGAQVWESDDSGMVVPLLELSDEDVARLDLHDGSTADWITAMGSTPTLTAMDFGLYST